MRNEGPILESLTRRLAETPEDFLAEPRVGRRGRVQTAAVVGDLIRLLGGDAGPEQLTAFVGRSAPPTLTSELPEYAEADPPAFAEARLERNRFSVTLILCWLLSDEWKGMILVGLYCGLRLSDVATLTWANADLEQQELVVTTQKTGRRQILPLAAPLLRHLESLPADDDPTAPLFPRACAARERSQYGGTLSNQFYGILVAAGLAKPRPHTSTGKGRDVKRDVGGLSFHCLRHTATSLLKNAGVSDAVARDIIGHDNPAVSAAYTHIDMEAKRRAVEKLPDVMQ